MQTRLKGLGKIINNRRNFLNNKILPHFHYTFVSNCNKFNLVFYYFISTYEELTR